MPSAVTNTAVHVGKMTNLLQPLVLGLLGEALGFPSRFFRRPRSEFRSRFLLFAVAKHIQGQGSEGREAERKDRGGGEARKIQGQGQEKRMTREQNRGGGDTGVERQR